MRAQSKAVLKAKLQVQKSSRIQGVPDADETSVEAITVDSWCILWVETVGADTSWPVLGNTL